ncbi:hypothetical protein NUW54_g596 [Trametes sanguinea]|uniref:Uncharacterized protein n=1 Tax=Trametes sanguinea TaxID=158606 RepID=A0ACC1QBV8_9APHY|nr:hypothetical protein NUW54_g596 [Trametes sanguinea]
MPSDISYLRLLLASLPPTLPYSTAAQSSYKFQDFGVDDDDIQELGLAGAVNHELEVRLGDRTKRGDTFEIKERGPGIEALADVLLHYQEMLPEDILLSKWITDACRAAEMVYQDAGILVPEYPGDGNTTVVLTSDTESAASLYSTASNTSDSDSETVASTHPRWRHAAATGNSTKGMQARSKPAKPTGTGKGGQRKHANLHRSCKRLDTKVLESFDDPRYTDLDEKRDTRAGGGKLEPLLPKVSKLCRASQLPSGLTSPFYLTLLFSPPILSSEYLSLSLLLYEGVETDKMRVRLLASAACNQTWLWPRNQQRILAHATGGPWLPERFQSDARHLLAAKVIKVAKEAESVTVTSVRRKREAKDSESKSDATRPDASKHESGVGARLLARNTKQARSGTAVASAIQLEASATPAKGGLQSFAEQGAKNLKNSGDHALTLLVVGCNLPPSSLDTLFFKNFVSAIQPKYNPPSASTMKHHHIPNEAARLQVEVVLKLSKIRNLMLSFDGGKLRRPRGIYMVTVTTPSDRQSFIISLNDASHVSHTARYIAQEVLNPINGLEEFTEMIQNVKDILTYMHHSTYAMEHYKDIRRNMKIQTGLVRIGKTRFWTYIAAVDSIYQGLPAFRELVEKHQLSIDIASKNHLFKKHSVDTTYFEVKLMQYLAVTTLFAHAIKCLESATATVADVYAYWLAIMSRLEYIMSDPSRTKLSTRTMEDIRAIAIQWFNELLEDGYRAAPVLDKGQTNPLAIPSIRIQRDPATRKPSLSENLREYGGKDMVDRNDIQEIMTTRNPLLAPFGPLEAYERLRKELYAYADEESPFTRTLRSDQTVLQWWEKVQKDDDGQILGALAIKIFSVVPHSMADERLMSVITWLNDPRFAPTRRRKSLSCVRHWCDLDPQLRTPATDSAADSSSDGSDDEDDQGPLAEQRILEDLCEGAKMGDLHAERRDGFVAGSMFALRSEFLRDMLADKSERTHETSTSTSQHASHRHAASSTKPTIRPSQVNWDQWAPALAKQQEVNHI